jgi:hypothetical protein
VQGRSWSESGVGWGGEGIRARGPGGLVVLVAFASCYRGQQRDVAGQRAGARSQKTEDPGKGKLALFSLQKESVSLP